MQARLSAYLVLGALAAAILVGWVAQARAARPRVNKQAVQDIVADAAREATLANTSSVPSIRLRGAARALGMLDAVRALLGDAASEACSDVNVSDFSAWLRTLEQSALKALPDSKLTKESYAAVGNVSR